MPRRNYQEKLIKSLQDPDEALAYIREALKGVKSGEEGSKQALLLALSNVTAANGNEETLSIEEAFGELYKDTGKPAMLLRGFRKRDELTQTELAKKLGTTQSSIAEMENGQRKIGLKTAKKIAAFFDADYKEFV